MLRREDSEKPEREVSLWLERNEIPYERYKNLRSYDKVVLRSLLCIPTRPTTHSQRKDLYKKLCLPDIAGKDAIDPVDFMPHEELERFFTPVAPSETLTKFEKY